MSNKRVKPCKNKAGFVRGLANAYANLNLPSFEESIKPKERKDIINCLKDKNVKIKV